jgi:predicted nucleic acid-binding Zn ribbon protein
MSLVQCPQCPERMVADRLKDHLRYQHVSPNKHCDHCDRPLERDVSRGHGKRFCDGRCQSLNYHAMLKAKRALEEYKTARGLSHP